MASSIVLVLVCVLVALAVPVGVAVRVNIGGGVRVGVGLGTMNRVYSPARSTVTFGNTTAASGLPPMLRTFSPPEQGPQLTDIECLINLQVTPDHIEGFESVRPRQPVAKTPEAPKPVVPVFGRRVKRYSNRV